MLRQDGWAEKYNPKNQFHVNQYDYSRCKEYLAALKEKWQEYEDPECEFEDYVNVSNYSNYDDYAYRGLGKRNWILMMSLNILI